MKKVFLILLIFYAASGHAQTNKGVLIHGINNGLWVKTGNLGIGIAAPTARLHLPSGTATASTAPLKFSSGTNLTTPEDGAIEYNGTHYYGTIGSTRYQLDQNGITSINGEIGPAYSISTGTGLTSSLSSNSIAVSVDVNSTDLPHVIDKQFTDANNSNTSETDLYSKSIAANTLVNNGASIHFDVAGQLNDATATVDIRFYFGGTSFGNTGALTLSTTGAWSARGYVIRATSTTARAFVTFTTQSASTTSYTFETDLTGLDFTTTNILKVTGQAGGATGGSNDITAKTWKLIFQP